MSKMRARAARLRRVHVHAAQDVRSAQGRRRSGRRRVRLQRRAGAVPAGPDRHARPTARYALEQRPESLGKVREFLGNVPQIVKAYAWARAMGADGIREASDISVIANNYMEARLLAIRGVTRSHPDVHKRRMEMTRYSLGTLTEETGRDRAGRAEPDGRLRRSTRPGSATSRGWFPSRSRPRPASCGRRRTSTTGSTCSPTCATRPTTTRRSVRSAPHNQPIHKLDYTGANDPDRWATTWRAYVRKHAASTAGVS